MTWLGASILTNFSLRLAIGVRNFPDVVDYKNISFYNFVILDSLCTHAAFLGKVALSGHHYLHAKIQQ
jgi:hypothetical protein